jgi:hypothetical protein
MGYFRDSDRNATGNRAIMGLTWSNQRTESPVTPLFNPFLA